MPDGDQISTRDEPEDRTARFGEVFAVREFQFLWLALAQSGIGDQLAKVALSILVFNKTGSPLLTAATYGVTYIPYLVAGPLLSPLADRYPRRRMLIICDVIRGLLVGAMIIPGVPLWSLFVLVFCTSMARPPFEAARASILPDILPGDRFVVGSAITQTTNQVTQVAGFAVGGIAVAAIGAPAALALNAASFFLGALLFVVGVRPRNSAQASTKPRFREVVSRGTQVILGDARMRTLIGLGMLAGFYIAPEALAVPYVRSELDLTAMHAGVMLAMNPLGTALGAVLLTRLLRPSKRLTVIGPLAVVGLLFLLPFWFVPDFGTSCVLLFCSGLAAGYNLATSQAFVAIVPNASRGHALGLAQTMLMLAQGAATFVAGAVAKGISTSATIAMFGAVGAVVAVCLWLAWIRAQQPRGAHRV